MTTLLRTDKDIEDIYRRYVDMLYRVAYSFMKNSADAEDMVQETFIRLLRSGTSFASEQHEKAWLIVTVSNLCKSALRSPWQRREALDAVLALPEDYKLPVYLYYYEGYPTADIARMLDVAPATVRSRLNRARKKLKLTLGGVYDRDA